MEDKLLDKSIAECVGLWLAEGDNKTTSEITFTNNCLELIDFFYKTINKLFEGNRFNPRIYVYCPDKEIRPNIGYFNCVVKYYVHQRATKPYYIFRIASVHLVKEWHKIIKKYLDKKKFSADILRGFFAGEGNIYAGSKGSRKLRISQGVKKKYIDNLLQNLNLTSIFDPSHRNYVINKKANWDIFAKLKIADLHPIKKEKFWKNYDFKQEHYGKMYLISEVFKKLDVPHTTKQLSLIFRRSPARICDVVMELKSLGKINNFRIGNLDYWTNKDIILISKLKKDYLLFLNKPKLTSEFAKIFGVDWKSSFRRLKELEKLNLIKRQKNGKWIKMKSKRKILVI